MKKLSVKAGIAVLLFCSVLLSPSAYSRSRLSIADWKTSVTKHFLVHHHKDVDERYIEEAAVSAESVFRRFAGKLKLSWKEPNSIFIYPDRSYFLINAIYGQGEIYLDTGGDVDLFKHRVVIAADLSVSEFRKTVKRLVLTSMLYRKLMGTSGNVIRLVKSAIYAEWIILGTAEYFTKEDDPVREGFLNNLFIADSLYKLTELYNFDYLPRAKQRTALAQSAEMVKWLISRWGEEKLWEIFSIYPDYWSNDWVLGSVLKLNQDQFLTEFKKSITLEGKGPAYNSAVRMMNTEGRFKEDVIFPAVHYGSDRVFFTGDHDGGRNVFEINQSGDVKRLFREVPFRTIEGVVHPLKFRRGKGILTGVKFLKPVDIEIAFSLEGEIKETNFRPHAAYKPCMMNNVCVLDAVAAAGEEEIALCEDNEGQFVGEITASNIIPRARVEGIIAGLTFSPKTGLTYFSASLTGDNRNKLYSVDEEGVIRLELDSPYGIFYPGAGRRGIYFSAPGTHQFNMYFAPYDILYQKTIDTSPPARITQKESLENPVLRREKGVNPVSSDIVIPGILWNSSDEFGLNELWFSFAFSTGIISTSGFENDSTGAFIAPLLKGAYMHKFPWSDFRFSAEYQFGDILDVRDYEERNKLTVDSVFDITVNTRILLTGGLRVETSERADADTDDYDNFTAIGPLVGFMFNGVIERERLPRRGGGCLLNAARFYESLGSSSTYTQIEFDADAFFPVTEDSVLQLHGGVYAAYGENAPSYDMGRIGGVMSQALFEHSGQYMGVARVMYRLPLYREINWTASGVILLKQIRMGLFADMGVVSDRDFGEWKQDEPFLTARKSLGAVLIFELYPVEGFQIPLILSYAVDPDRDTYKVSLEFQFYF